MYANFIYFIVALLIYTTYQPADEPYFNLAQSLVYMIALFAGYAVLGWVQFRRFTTRMNLARITNRGHQFNLCTVTLPYWLG